MFQLQPRQIVLVVNQVSGFVDYSILEDAVALTGFRPDDVIINQGLEQDLKRAIAYTNVRGKVAEFLTNLTVENPAAQEEIGSILLNATRKGPDPSEFGFTQGPGMSKPYAGVLEAKVAKNAQKLPFALYLERASWAALRICRIEFNDGHEDCALGTGFLVGRDLVLTNHHVWQPVHDGKIAAQTVRCRFDYTQPGSGTPISLMESPLMAKSPFAPGDDDPAGREPNANELDYALLKISQRVGNVRGWYDLALITGSPQANAPIKVVGHSDGFPASISEGSVLQYAGHGRRLRHDAWTEPGNSGSPIYDANFELVALHHATDPNISKNKAPKYNQGIPLKLIQADILSQLGSARHAGP